MKKLLYIGLCIVLTFVCAGCSPHRSETTKEPKTAKECFDPEGLMTLETFEMDKRDVANFSGPLTRPDENPKTTYYGYQASVMFNIGNSWEYSNVTGFTYLLAHISYEELVDTLCLIIDDAISIYGEPHAMFCNNSPVNNIDIASLYLSHEEGCPSQVRWEWIYDDHTIKVEISTYLHVVFVTYEQL